MYNNKRKFRWRTIAIALSVVVALTLLFTAFFPWLALLSSLALVGVAITYASWKSMYEKIAKLKSLPVPSLQRRLLITVPFVVYGIVLFALSQSQIRANWRVAETRAEVAQKIENAKTALEEERVDSALRICNLIEEKANADEKAQLEAIRTHARTKKNAHRIDDANSQVRRLVSDGQKQLLRQNVDGAQATLEKALKIQMATEFATAIKLANAIVAARTKFAIDFLEAGELDKAKQLVEEANNTPSATDTVQANRIAAKIANREVEGLVKSARKALANMNRDQAASHLENALAIRNATETAEAEKMFANIRSAREAEANARVATLMQNAQQLLDAKDFADAIRTLETAIAIPSSTRKVEVTAMLRVAQKHQAAEKRRLTAAAKLEQRRRADAEATRKAKEEYEQNGLVLLRQTVKAKTGQFGGEITGTVVNRRKKKLAYAQITFNLYDNSGAQVGSAMANINGLESGGRWKFKASSIGTHFSKYKINELTGF